MPVLLLATYRQVLFMCVSLRQVNVPGGSRSNSQTEWLDVSELPLQNKPLPNLDDLKQPPFI